ncbi:MAG: hypothetical protein AB7S75_06960 [Desulfococcaceae bacterium]
MEELFQLRSLIRQSRNSEALILIGEMAAGGRDSKICGILSYTDILLHYLIVKYAERRLTRSGEAGARNSIDMILRINRRRGSGGYYLDKSELMEVIQESWPMAIRRASFEAFEGRYDEYELAEKIDASQIKKEALQLIIDTMEGVVPPGTWRKDTDC